MGAKNGVSPGPSTGVSKSKESSMSIEELRKQLQLSQKRENLANLRLTVKEKQLRDLMDENESMKRNASEENRADCTLVDHAVGVMFTAMRDEIRKARKDAKLATLELKALKNGPQSNEAKELVSMFRKLEKEHTELKNEVSRIARLETLLALCKKTTEGLRKRCRDVDEVLAERNEEIKRLQLELARAHEENARLKRRDPGETDGFQGDNQSSRHTDHNNQNADISAVTNEDEVVSVSSPESVHEVEEEEQMVRVLTPGVSAVEAVNVSSPESTHEDVVPEAETISSDEQDADPPSSKGSSFAE